MMVQESKYKLWVAIKAHTKPALKIIRRLRSSYSFSSNYDDTCLFHLNSLLYPDSRRKWGKLCQPNSIL